jgi:hypothetical protein
MDIGFIYTNNNSEEITINNRKIKVIPFWKEALKT